MEEAAQNALAAFIAWIEADDFINPELDYLTEAMGRLAKEVGMSERWRELLGG